MILWHLMRCILTKSYGWLAKIYGLTKCSFIAKENILEIIFFRCSGFAEEKVVIFKKKVTDMRCLSTYTNTMSHSCELVMFDKSGEALYAQNVQGERGQPCGSPLSGVIGPMWSSLKRTWHSIKVTHIIIQVIQWSQKPIFFITSLRWD